VGGIICFLFAIARDSWIGIRLYANTPRLAPAARLGYDDKNRFKAGPWDEITQGTSGMAQVSDIFDAVDLENPDRPRQRTLVSAQEDLIIALNVYTPGARNEFHYHKGTSQSFLCVKGELTVRTMDEENGPVTKHTLTEGKCVLVPGGQYYQLHNESDQPALLYQVKKPGDQIVIMGKGQVSNKDYFTEKRQRQHAL
jgi:mannose-6-phosphate isomerase-like protein (cupin superfamily)